MPVVVVVPWWSRRSGDAVVVGVQVDDVVDALLSNTYVPKNI